MTKSTRTSPSVGLLSRRMHWIKFVLGSAAVVAAWIFIPTAYDPYVRLQSSTLPFNLTCVPSTVAVYLRSGLGAPDSVEAQIIVSSDAKAGPVAVPVRTAPLADQPGLRIDPTPDGTKLFAKAAKSFPAGSRVLYTVVFDHAPSIDVQRIEVSSGPAPGGCHQEVLAGRDLKSRLDDPAAQVMRYRILQEEVGNIVFRSNGIFANFVLGGMLVALLWFTYILAAGFRQLYGHSDKKLLEALKERERTAVPELRALGPESLVEAEFIELNRRLGFAKTMGPALGFLLTVSSLSAALHPSAEAPQDTYRLISGIQLAVIGTFVGLAIRIITHYAQRIYRDLTERKLDLIVAVDSVSNSDPC